MKPRFTILFVALTCSMLSGCGLQRWENRQNATYSNKQCFARGLQPGTPEYSACMKQEKIKLLNSDERFIQEMTNT